MEKIARNSPIGSEVVVHRNERGEATLTGMVKSHEVQRVPHIASPGYTKKVSSVYYEVTFSRRAKDVGLVWREDFDFE